MYIYIYIYIIANIIFLQTCVPYWSDTVNTKQVYGQIEVELVAVDVDNNTDYIVSRDFKISRKATKVSWWALWFQWVEHRHNIRGYLQMLTVSSACDSSISVNIVFDIELRLCKVKTIPIKFMYEEDAREYTFCQSFTILWDTIR